MKTIKYLFLIAVGSMFLPLTSCDDYLNLKPVIGESSEIQFGYEAGAETALVGCYDIMAKDGRYFFWIYWLDGFQYTKSGMWIGTDSPEAVSIQNGSYPMNNTGLTFLPNMWSGPYLQIVKCNYFINKVVNTPFADPKRKQEAIGEARCLRAFNYFQLVQFFKRVPLTLSPTDTDYPFQVEPDAIYKVIMEDLRFAYSVLPPKVGIHIVSNKTGLTEDARVTKGTAAALLSKVFLTSQNNPYFSADSSAIYANDVITNPAYGYKLLENFSDLWKVANKRNSESIYQVSNSTLGFNGGSTIASWGSPGQTWFRVQGFMKDLFQDERITTTAGKKRILDLRRDATIDFLTAEFTGDGQIYCLKYLDGKNGSHTDNPCQYILRLADIYLIKAEALCSANYDANKDQIVEIINIIRDRGFGCVPKAYTEEMKIAYRLKASDVTSKLDMDKIIEDERRRELFFEAQLWFDMKRTGRFVDFYFDGDQTKKYLEYMPIPPTEMKLNQNLKQIEGYN